MSFDAADLIPKASGEVMLRFAVSDLQVAARILAEQGARIGEPSGASNRGQPGAPETSRTFSAAGSAD